MGLAKRVERNRDILPEHANHPGWHADGCPLRITVRPVWSAEARPGFACSWTGGHCVPGAMCDDRRAKGGGNGDA